MFSGVLPEFERALMPASMLSSFIAFDVSLRHVPG
jgi:hypothetical protein